MAWYRVQPQFDSGNVYVWTKFFVPPKENKIICDKFFHFFLGVRHPFMGTVHGLFVIGCIIEYLSPPLTGGEVLVEL